MPINVNAQYNLTLGSTTIPYTLVLGQEIPLCTSTGLDYYPTSGTFNVVHQNYYDIDIGGVKQFYNLPTQVTSRVGNFKVIALKESDHNALEGMDTIVAVDMFDASSFHDTYAACNELSTSISPRVWVMFENNATSTAFDKQAIDNAIASKTTDLTSSESFYSQARQNAAFRVTYNTTSDGSESLVQTERVGTNYKILNFTDLVQNIGSCASTIEYPVGNSGNTQSTRNISNACGNNGNTGITKEHLKACMECVYGLYTKAACSRDNFSIRPEAFLIKLHDQNQTDTSFTAPIASNVSGVSSPTSEVVNMAAGYNYKIEVNATNNINNNASQGYTNTFNLSADEVAQYNWETRTGVASGACNDEDDKLINMRFLDGSVDVNTSNNQVGEYRLNIKDTYWTSVDSNILYMGHHTSPYFKMDGATPYQDCKANTTLTQLNNSITLNGCDISSSHVNSNANIIYNDYNVTFHPYKFDMSGITPSVGPNNNVLTPASFVYMANMSQDQDMSFHLNGKIKAVGYNDSNLSNFVNNCYAVPIDLNLSKSDTTLLDVNGNAIVYQSRFHNLNLNGVTVTANDIDTNESNPLASILVQTPQNYFIKDMNGTINTIHNLNYGRTVNNAANPISVTFNSYDVNCTNPATDCSFNADLINNKTTQSSLNIDKNITHYYGRNNSQRQVFSTPVGTTASPANDFIYYEVFCDGAGCYKTLLQNGVDSNISDDPRWFINENHTSAYGTAGNINQKGAGYVTATDSTGNHQDSTDIIYDNPRGYPYKATMETNSSNWLIYNKYNSVATSNTFEVEFVNATSSWAGKDEANSTTQSSGASKTNRRTMW